MNIKNKNIAVIGFGVEGRSSAFYLAKGNSVTIHDKKSKKDFSSENLEELDNKGIKMVFGENYLNDLDKYDLIVRSPGIREDAVREHLKNSNTLVTSQTEIFLHECPCFVIGVTGTKGKGTTATLIYQMLNNSGIKTYLGGNIGTPPFEFLDELMPEDRVVLELSSFQLMGISKSPNISVLLMMTSEHLDYHKDHAEYIDSKRNILRFQTDQDIAIINRDYPASNESDVYTEGRVFQVTTERESVDDGCYIKEGAIWAQLNNSEWKIIDTDKIALLGKHNLENACAASLAAALAGADKKEIVDVLGTFKGLPHRLEFVKEINGVDYYNDSFSTTPETAIAAIDAFDKPEVLILGGSGKNSDFSLLADKLEKSENVKVIIGVGTEWERIKKSLKNLPKHILIFEGARDMHTVVQAAHKIAKTGDVVLLSPACASFGMFQNYKDRGEQFRKEVELL